MITHNPSIAVLPELQRCQASAVSVARHTSQNFQHSALHETARLLFFSTTSAKHTKAKNLIDRRAKIFESNSPNGSQQAQGAIEVEGHTYDECLDGILSRKPGLGK
ncbi:unnamed protein product [Clonostachys byssicola]|uniref:Uncharacterized protein n=1 Tax=Clonostachys byssicola TaxID=160290 RepID=A0A9N9UZP7_9HYPO|nr:unnamed protein product [Clonostachys byssicola]